MAANIDQNMPSSDVDSEIESVDETPSSDDILATARERLALAEEAETDIRLQALDDLNFRAGEQWPANVQQDRNRDGRPCLVINRLPQFVQQVTNDQRQNRPAIKVHPVDDLATEDTAGVIQGLIRHIEYNSNADVAYDTAFESAVTGGFGYFRIITDYSDPESFDQEILIKRIRNPFSVFFDPYSQEPDGSDANWVFIVDDMSRDDYRAQFPNSKLASSDTNWSDIGNDQPGWIKSGDSARIAEYYCKEFKEETIHLLSTGLTVRDAELHDALAKAQAANLPAHVVRSRKTRVPIIKWYKLNAIEILEQTEWPGSYIPIVPVYGSELYINGRRILESVVRNAKDSQRMYNYWASAETEAIALAPRAPYMVAEGQIEGYEEIWETSNRSNHAYLPYKPTTIAGQPAQPPIRQTFEPAVAAITNARMMAADDLKSTTGIYDAAVGAQSNEVSGIAIQRRAGQTQTSNFHFVDNLTRSLRHAGRILVDLIPRIYDTARAARIIGDDGEQKVVRINDPNNKDESGRPLLYALDVGRYDVTVDTGPSFASKRQEAAASMMDLTQKYPQIMQLAGDLLVKNMDWPGAQEIAERIKKTLPPGIADDPKQQQIPPQAQAQMQQMSAMIKQLSSHLDEATKVIETKKLDLEHRERIELMKTQAQIEMKLAELGTKSSIALLQEEVGAISHRLKFLGMDQPINAPSDFNPEEADGGNYAGIGHIGGTTNLTGGQMPGQTPGANP